MNGNAMRGFLGTFLVLSVVGAQDVYVANQAVDTVTVFEARNPANTATIVVGTEPHEIGIHPAGRWIYVSNRLDDTVSVLDGALRVEIDTDANPANGLTRISVGSLPHGIAVAPDGALLAVANNLSDDLSMIDATSLQTVATVPGIGMFPHMCRYTPDGLQIWAVNLSGSVRIVDAALAVSNPASALGPLIQVNGSTEGIAFSPDGQRAFVARGFGTNSIAVIDTVTLAVSTIFVGLSPLRIEVHPSGACAYVANFSSNELSVIDLATSSIVRTVTGVVNPVGIGFSPDGQSVLAAGFAGSVFVIDHASGTVQAIVPAGPGADGLVHQPAILKETQVPTVGGQALILMRRPQDFSLPYQAACAFTDSPGIVIGTRSLALTPDPMFFLSVSGHGSFPGFAGTLDLDGGAMFGVTIPADPSVLGVEFYVAAATLDAAAPQGLRTLTTSLRFQVQ